MSKNMLLNLFAGLLGLVVAVPEARAEGFTPRTRVAVVGGRWRINGAVTYPGARVEGLLINVRMVNAVFEDRNRPEFDPEANTDEFLAQVPDYVAHGVRAFTLCLQGGMPGYEGAVNSAFDPDGSLREPYLRRVRRVVEACDRQGVAVILGCYYQRQDQILRDEAAVRRGIVNVAEWVEDCGFTNVILEVANEFPHRGFDHNILRSPQGQAELIRLAKRSSPGLLVSTSGIGDGRLPDAVAGASDVLLIHFNSVPVAAIPGRIAALKSSGKAIVCNEDDKTGDEAARAAEAAVASGASYGLMLSKVNQDYPFHFQGAADDPVVYRTLRRLTSAQPEDEGARVRPSVDLSHGPLRVSENRRFLVHADGTPFFYLGDTAWELFHRLDRKQAAEYLDVRARQRYTVIQAVALAELDGLRVPNAYGDLPLIDDDPTRPAVTPGADPDDPEQYDYWDHVEFIVDEANRRGLHVGLLPTWGRWATNELSRGDDVVKASNARAYGEFLGKRFGEKSVIWVLGGDRTATGHEDVWRNLADGIAAGVGGDEGHSAALMTYHPRGGRTSSTWFHRDRWLDFNMQQTGHRPVQQAPQCWTRIAEDYAREPIKPVIDGEPLYEDHPIGFREAPRWGYSLDAHVRQRAYWDVFSGACGHTYGNHAVWQMYAPGRSGVNGPLYYWYEAIHRPGATQMRHLRDLIESRPFLSRVPDPSLVAEPYAEGEHIAATRGDGYAFIYSGQGRAIRANLGKSDGERIKAWWYNPRDGAATPIGVFDNAGEGEREFAPPSFAGFGADWVLVLDDANRDFAPPGTSSLIGEPR